MATTRTMTNLRPFAAHTIRSRQFHTTHKALVQVGDAIPDIELMENSPGSKISIAKEMKGKGLIIGVPGAFSPACSASHIPGYLNSPRLKHAGQVFVVSVNDPFTVKAWAASLDEGSKSGVCIDVHAEKHLDGFMKWEKADIGEQIRFLADAQGAFTRAVEMEWDATAAFGQPRSKRYALLIEDGKVKEAHVEPDNTGVNVSAADKVLGRA
ncbi:hypothetical protein LTR86_006704 [Recurvomyces mirabilis]|nr:hypothetical protein LTR86_006704 [Recurvomyces mirabilis]